ncbi:Transient receptor potential cation channel subfamily M member 1 [Lamellibrachia satsuma]|nr:Transient receptor potential cation channel subfamily M member 1 [Lamellibrachia satsuma]
MIQDILNGRFTPRTKFVLHMASYVIMLMTFSVMLLTELPRDSQDSHIGLLEWTVCVFMFNWIIHEAVQFGSTYMRTNRRTYFHIIKSGCKEYVRNEWNKIDLVGYVLFVVAFSLRLGGQLDHARGFYSVSILVLYMRFLQVFMVFKTIGLHVSMVGLAIRDLLKFLLVLAVFIMSYGVASRALLFPKSELSWALLRDIVYLPYWQLYGELQLEEIEDDDDSHAGHSTLAIFMFAVYMMMAHILLLNLLIATFTHSITQIQADKNKSWYYVHFNSRSLLREYEGCIDVPPPFSTLVYIYQLCSRLIRRSGQSNNTDPKQERRQQLQMFQNAEMKKFLEKTPVAEHADEAIVARLQSLEETMNTLRGTLEDIKHWMNKHV